MRAGFEKTDMGQEQHWCRCDQAIDPRCPRDFPHMRDTESLTDASDAILNPLLSTLQLKEHAENKHSKVSIVCISGLYKETLQN